MTKKYAMRAAVEALEMAHTGLMWYRGMMPEYADGSDDEADEQINSALSLLRSALEEGEDMANAASCVRVDSPVLTDVEILDLAQDFRVVERPTSYEPYETFDYVGFARAIIARAAAALCGNDAEAIAEKPKEKPLKSTA